jgi:hypothetical protein
MSNPQPAGLPGAFFVALVAIFPAHGDQPSAVAALEKVGTWVDRAGNPAGNETMGRLESISGTDFPADSCHLFVKGT